MADARARIGTTVAGKWRLEQLLGKGGSAAVYVGVHTIGRRDAIKILHAHVNDLDMRQRFEREAYAVNQLRHPGIVEIRDVGHTEDGCPFLVMELLEGEDLKRRIERVGNLPVEQLLRFVDELLDALGAAHARGIVHRDIKLENLFVTNDGRLKVVDFGIAKVRGASAITQAGDILGTLPYMAPEQIAGETIDARTDIFAVGATMFRALAKRRIHEASSKASLMLAMGRNEAPALRSVLPTVDPSLAAVVDRALRFRPDDRFQSAAEMQLAVRALRSRTPNLELAPGPGQALVAAAPARAAMPASVRWLIVGLSAAVVVLAAGVVLLLAKGGRPPDPPRSKVASAGTTERAQPATPPSAPRASSSVALPQPGVPPASTAKVDLMGVDATVIPAAVQARFGAAIRVMKVVVLDARYYVTVIDPADSSHFDEYLVAAVVPGTPHQFVENAHGKGDPGNLASQSFALGDIDWTALARIGKDAPPRSHEKATKVFSFNIEVDDASVIIRAYLDVRVGEFIDYDARGRFLKGP